MNISARYGTENQNNAAIAWDPEFHIQTKSAGQPNMATCGNINWADKVKHSLGKNEIPQRVQERIQKWNHLLDQNKARFVIKPDNTDVHFKNMIRDSIGMIQNAL